MPNDHIKTLLRSVSGETMSRPPWWLMRQAGRYLPRNREIRAGTREFLRLCRAPSPAAGGEGPVFAPREALAGLALLDRSRILPRLEPVFEAIERVQASLGPETA